MTATRIIHTPGLGTLISDDPICGATIEFWGHPTTWWCNRGQHLPQVPHRHLDTHTGINIQWTDDNAGPQHL